MTSAKTTAALMIEPTDGGDHVTAEAEGICSEQDRQSATIRAEHLEERVRPHEAQRKRRRDRARPTDPPVERNVHDDPDHTASERSQRQAGEKDSRPRVREVLRDPQGTETAGGERPSVCQVEEVQRGPGERKAQRDQPVDRGQVERRDENVLLTSPSDAVSRSSRRPGPAAAQVPASDRSAQAISKAERRPRATLSRPLPRVIDRRGSS